MQGKYFQIYTLNICLYHTFIHVNKAIETVKIILQDDCYRNKQQ